MMSQSRRLACVVSLVIAVAGCGGRGVVTKAAADSAGQRQLSNSPRATSITSGSKRRYLVHYECHLCDHRCGTVDYSGTRVVHAHGGYHLCSICHRPRRHYQCERHNFSDAQLAAPSIKFSASPASISLGLSSVLVVHHKCNIGDIDSGVKSTALSGSATVAPTGTHTYILMPPAPAAPRLQTRQ